MYTHQLIIFLLSLSSSATAKATSTKTTRECAFLLCSDSPIEQGQLDKNNIRSTLDSNPASRRPWNQCFKGQSTIQKVQPGAFGSGTGEWPKCKQGVLYGWTIDDYSTCEEDCTHGGTNRMCKPVTDCHEFGSEKWDVPDEDGLSIGIKALSKAEFPK